MAVFIDFLREITLADEISGSKNQSLEEARLLLETELEDPQYRFFKDASSEFGTLYKRQSRQWTSPKIPGLANQIDGFDSFYAGSSDEDNEAWAGWEGHTNVFDIGSHNVEGLCGKLLRFTGLHEIALVP